MGIKSTNPPEHRRIDKDDKVTIAQAIKDGFDFVGTIHHYEKALKYDDVSIYPATDNDRDAVIEIMLSTFKHSRFFSVSKALAHKVYRERVHTAFDTMTVFVAVPDMTPEKRVGFAVLDGNDIPFIAVAQEYQGRGIGKMLLDKCCEKCRTRGYKSIKIATQGSNVNAKRLYEKSGFNKTKIEKDFHK